MSLAGISNYFVPLSLDGLDAFTQSVQDNALLLDGSNAMLADINCGTHAVKNMAAAVTSDEAVNLGQLTTTLGNYVDLTTNQSIDGLKTFTSQVTFSGATKTNLVATDIPNAGTLTWLNSSGTQTISGSKSWANSQTWSGPNANFNTTTFNVSATTTTNLSNGALCGSKRLQNVADPTAAQDASTKNYADTQGALRVLKAGDTMTGSLAMGTNAVTSTADPTTNDQLSRKGYVDAQDALRVLKSGDSMSGNLAMGGNKVTGLANGVATSDAAAVGQVLLLNGTQAMTGNLNVGSNRVVGVGNGTAGTDAVNVNQLTDARYIQVVQTVTTNIFTISDSTPTVTLCNFNGGIISLPSTGVTAGKLLRFINIFNGPNNVLIWSNSGTGTIDGVTGSQQAVELAYMQSVEFLARGSGSYTTCAINMLLPHARVQCNLGLNDISLWTWDGVALNATAERLRVGSSAVTSFVPFAPRAWSSGQVMKTWLFNQVTDGSAIKTCPNGVTTDWKTFSVTSCQSSLKGNWSSTYLSLHVDVPYHVAGDGQDNFIVDVYDVTNGGSQMVMRKSQYYDGQGGGGTRASPMFPLLASWRPNHNTTIYTRSVRIRIINQSGVDTVYLGAGVDGGGVTNLNFDWFTARFEEISV